MRGETGSEEGYRQKKGKDAERIIGRGHLGGSVVEHLPSAQMDEPQVLGSSPTSGSLQGAYFSLCLYLCLSIYMPLMNK